MSGLELRLLDPADASARRAWDEAVGAFAGGTVFHTTAWMDVVEKGFGLPSRFAYLAGANGSIRALVPLFRAGGWARPIRWLNLMQGCDSTPLAAEEADAARLLELVAASAAAAGSSAVILRSSRKLETAAPRGWEARTEDPVVRHVLDLRGARDVPTLPRIQKGQMRIYKRISRRLEAGGVEVRVINCDETGSFTRAVHRILLARHGHMGLPKKFFGALLQFLPRASRLLVACPRSGPELAFSVVVMSPSGAHMLYGSGLTTTEGADAYRFCVGQQIEAAIRAGLPRLDFGESGPQQEGLIYFKETWGAQRSDNSYQVIARKGVSSGLNVQGRSFALAQRLLHYVPVDVSVMMAELVHRALQ